MMLVPNNGRGSPLALFRVCCNGQMYYHARWVKYGCLRITARVGVYCREPGVKRRTVGGHSAWVKRLSVLWATRQSLRDELPYPLAVTLYNRSSYRN